MSLTQLEMLFEQRFSKDIIKQVYNDVNNNFEKCLDRLANYDAYYPNNINTTHPVKRPKFEKDTIINDNNGSDIIINNNNEQKMDININSDFNNHIENIKQYMLWDMNIIYIIYYWFRNIKIKYNIDIKKYYLDYLLYLIIDFTQIGHFYPNNDKRIKLINNGLTALNETKLSYGTILFGFPFKINYNNPKMMNTYGYFKYIYYIKLRIDKTTGINQEIRDPLMNDVIDVCNPVLGIGFIKHNINISKYTKPEQSNDSSVIYSDGTLYTRYNNRDNRDETSLTFGYKSDTIYIEINFISKNALIKVEHGKSKLIDLNKHKNNDIQLCFVLDSQKNDKNSNKYTTQITILDQHWK